MGRTASKRTKKSHKISSRRKKTKRKESKKRHRDYHSDSSFSDDSSLNSKPSPSSSSLSDYRKPRKSKKPRRHDDSASFSDDRSIAPDSKSRKRKRSKTSSKSSKKKAHKIYNSSDSDSDEEHVTKQKRSTKDSVKPKKKYSKKKSKKHYSSSSDSDSLSGGSSIDADGKDQKGKAKNPNKKRKVRSPSFSKDEELSFSDEPVAPVNNSRRLKSVVIMVNPNCEEEEGGQKLEKDEHKEELVYDYDDYPSPRSLDSNEGGNDTEGDNLSHGTTSNKSSRVEDIEAGEIVTKPANSLVKEQDKSVPVAVLGGEDLESILRQKALENLRMRKLKLGIPNKDMNNENNDKEPLSKSADIVENKSVKLDSPNTQDVNKRSEFTEDVHKLPVGNKHGMSKETVRHPPKPAISNVVIESKVVPGGTHTNASSSSAIEPTSSGKHSSEEKPNEANASSEYEQKTMSVMRGGEMVQVSYKVYIPQRRPGLGRRQLRQ